MDTGKKAYKKAGKTERPYNFFGDYLRDRYGATVYKIPINAGLGCPNRIRGGCIFCPEDGSAALNIRNIKQITEQIRYVKKKLNRPGASYISYFQAYTNTNAPAAELKKLYDTALAEPDITGLMIGTRPDALPDDVLDLIAGYSREDFELWLEIGVQTFHDKSLNFLNRCHNARDSIDSITRALRRNIKVCAHIILGIPGESRDDAMLNAGYLSALGVSGVKIHHLHVIKNTPLEEMFKRGEIKVWGLKEYVSLVCDFIERLDSRIIIHRLIGDREPESLSAPLWSLKKGTALKSIEDEFRRRATRQGFLSGINITEIPCEGIK